MEIHTLLSKKIHLIFNLKTYRSIVSKNLKPIITIVLLIGFSKLNTAQNIVLGRPTDKSITASILFEQKVDFYISYGTQSGNYANQSKTTTNVANIPDEIDLVNLAPDARYYYKVFYKTSSASSYSSSPEYSFHTQRAKGSEFTFTMEADEHLYDKKGVKSMYEICLKNQANDKPDFMLSLGDIFGDDHDPDNITSKELDELHKAYRPFLGSLCHSVPFYVCLGNHEGEMDYFMNKKPDGENLAVWGTQWRKFYYPNPYPNDFYSGNKDVEPFNIGNPENYYAWNWGDALFVVLDAYRDQNDTSAKPKAWDWSLGKPQYDWLKTTLETSTAKYKFVFCHHINGQGRGGVTNAKLYEWGGYEQKGQYTFDTKRPGWGKPIHKLFVDNGVNIFFQGHDHVFAHEVLDGVTYQALPMPSDSTYQIGMLANADAYVSDTLDGTGHLRVKVKESCVTVDYVRAYLPADTLDGKHKNGEVAFSYTIGTCKQTTGIEENNKKNFLKIYPNPAKDKLTIQFSDASSIFSVKLINAIGQVIIETKSSEIDLSDVTNGIYFLSFEAEHYKSVNKVIVNH